MHATRVYTDYREMLARERLDVVSICTWDRHTPRTSSIAWRLCFAARLPRRSKSVAGSRPKREE
jgi:hypothetical protein